MFGEQVEAGACRRDEVGQERSGRVSSSHRERQEATTSAGSRSGPIARSPRVRAAISSERAERTADRPKSTARAIRSGFFVRQPAPEAAGQGTVPQAGGDRLLQDREAGRHPRLDREPPQEPAAEAVEGADRRRLQPPQGGPPARRPRRPRRALPRQAAPDPTPKLARGLLGEGQGHEVPERALGQVFQEPAGQHRRLAAAGPRAQRDAGATHPRAARLLGRQVGSPVSMLNGTGSIAARRARTWTRSGPGRSGRRPDSRRASCSPRPSGGRGRPPCAAERPVRARTPRWPRPPPSPAAPCLRGVAILTTG